MVVGGGGGGGGGGYFLSRIDFEQIIYCMETQKFIVTTKSWSLMNRKFYLMDLCLAITLTTYYLNWANGPVSNL